MSTLTLTPQQRKHVAAAYDKLKNREMVYLAGGPNGKTRMVHHTMEMKQPNRATNIIHAKHPEDNDIHFIRGLGYGRSDQMTIYTVMRQVVQSLGMKPAHGHWNITRQIEEVLAERAAKGEVLCISIDNADLLAARAYTIFKHLNEIRAHNEHVGCAVLVAGEFSKMKMPIEFLYRCTELRIEKLYETDIVQLINTHWPGMASEFDSNAVSLIKSQAPTLLEARHHLELVLREKRKLDMDRVTLPLVQRALALAA